ncbi:DUF6869 domain-containing protein [Novosphingobium sp.]|uniref:DUF6869 domain-containing protein n=1 Tax=Novosphingobium sp. TaxID=1874826 RepID=UPI002610C36F|nr:hypothetical protein [Novosphingobium sp.]
MSRKSSSTRNGGYADELSIALQRPDIEALVRKLDNYIRHHDKDWPDDVADDCSEVLMSGVDDPIAALAYLALAIERCDDVKFLALMACGTLEDLLRSPAPEILERVVAEARKNPRFRWLLSHPFKVAVSAEAWEAIKPFRITREHEEPPFDTFPAR